MKGFREPKKIARVENLEDNEKALMAAIRLNQMVIKQLIDKTDKQYNEITKLLSLVQNLQYKINAMVEVSKLDPVEIEKSMLVKQTIDFNLASDEEDKANNYTKMEKVESDQNIIIITSENTVESDKSIFRSKIKLADTAVPELITGLIGKSIGDKVEATMNGQKHIVELLGVRQVPEIKEEVKE